MNTINAVVIHKLIKERQGKATTSVAPIPLQLTDAVQKLVNDIHLLYAQKSGKGYGKFEEDETTYPSSKILRETFSSGKVSFIDCTHALMRALASRAGQVPLATGGYVLMAHVTNPAKISWFIVAIITNIKGSAIEDDTLKVIDSVHVDLQNLRVVGRVCLTDWLGSDPEIRYIGFLKQKGEVSDYFKLFLGCNDFIASVEETKKLVSFLKSYARDSGLDRNAQEAMLKAAYEYCSGCQKNNEPLSLEALSNTVSPTNPQKLQEALASEGVQVSDGFVPDGRSLRAFIKIKAKTAFWSVELDRNALVNGQAKFDSKKSTLTLSSLPESLVAELMNELGDG